MGLHCGYLVAAVEPDALLLELSRHAGAFVAGALVERVADADIDPGRFDLLLGGGDGRAFLVDTSMMLSTNADMIIAMSDVLGTVVGAGAETVSGSYWLTVARDGELLRHAFMSYASLTLGMSIGDPLASEDEFPLVDSSGDGVFAAMATFGLDPSAWLDSGPATVVTFDATRFPHNGAVDAIRRRHFEQYGRPEDAWLHEIVAVEASPSRRPNAAER
ncbi:hypothetical protein [Dactylosporangium sp. NPDC051541]|uniref:hypothetical protein n=1 Tax=Dactylosporangium sp. NPDC051541 TaxID=3363977 RepID=UPI0037BAD572